MENFEDNIEREYHERFHDFEEMPDDMIWSKIQERISPEPEKRPFIFWWNNLQKMGIAASILLMLLVGGYYFFKNNSPKNVQADNGISTKSTPKKLIKKENKIALKQQEIIDKNVTENHFYQKENKKVSTKSIHKNLQDFQNKFTLNEPKDENNNLIKNNNISENIEENNDILQKKVGILEQEKILLTNNQSKIIEASKQAGEKAVLNDETKNKIITEQKKSNIDIENTVLAKASINIENHKNETLIIDSQSFVSKVFEQDIPFLSTKKGVFETNKIPLIAPVLAFNEPENTFEKPPKERLVFIPPTEVFVNVSPMLSYYMFSPNKADNFLVNSFNPSSERLSFAAQLGFVYPIAKKLYLRTGFNFMTGKSKISYDFTNQNEKNVKIIDDHNIEISQTKSTNVELRNWQYLEVQSDLLYDIKRLHALSLGFRAGVQTNALKQPIFNARFGYRISKPVNNKVALWLEPSVSISLSSQKSIENLFIYRTTGFGLNMGVSLLRGY